MPTVVVDGVPAGAGNLRRGRGGALYNPDKRTAPWKGAVAAAVAAELGAEPASRLPIELDCFFFFVRPGGHFKKDGTLRASARRLPTVKPDADKLVRAVLDALTGVLYVDDAQVVWLTVRKAYGSRARLELSWALLAGAGPELGDSALAARARYSLLGGGGVIRG
ncbi:MAG TPA: RusA family crossover junction endodeoxyribonuclease [Gaiellaceae bacterium]